MTNEARLRVAIDVMRLDVAAEPLQALQQAVSRSSPTESGLLAWRP